MFSYFLLVHKLNDLYVCKKATKCTKLLSNKKSWQTQRSHQHAGSRAFSPASMMKGQRLCLWPRNYAEHNKNLTGGTRYPEENPQNKEQHGRFPPATPPHLGLLLLSGVDDGGAANLSQLATLAIEGPAADLVPDDVFDEEDAAVEAERQPVEQLDVLQQVVVRVAVEIKAEWCRAEVHELITVYQLQNNQQSPLTEYFERKENNCSCITRANKIFGGTFVTWCRSTCCCFCCIPASRQATRSKHKDQTSEFHCVNIQAGISNTARVL